MDTDKEIRFCKDCKHLIPYYMLGFIPIYSDISVCCSKSIKPRVNLITGEKYNSNPTSCLFFRCADDSPCGKEGMLFESKYNIDI